MSEALRLRVAVIGGSTCTSEEAGVAEEVGRRLAHAGVILLSGGRGGVMEAACRGARTAGGLTVGVLPGDQAGEANRWVLLPIVTAMGEARNAILMHTAEAVIAIGGEYGTLSEIAFALSFGRPVVGINTWQAVDSRERPLPIQLARSAEEAVAMVLTSLAGRERSVEERAQGS